MRNQAINPEEEIRKTVDFLKAYLVKHPFLNGMSLGLAADKTQRLLGNSQMAIDELNEEQDQKSVSFYAVRLPYGASR